MNKGEPNGCGPWWLSKNLKDGYFKEACTRHDKEYIAGMNRRVSDYRFYAEMLEVIGGESNDLVRVLRGLQAWFFFFIVRLFGWTSHKKGLNI